MTNPVEVTPELGLARPVALTLAAQVLVVGSRSIAAVVAARALGVDGQGALAVAIAVPSLLALVLGLGVPLALTFAVGREPARSTSLGGVGTALALAGGAAGILVVALAAAVGVLDVVVPDVPGGALIAALAALPVMLVRLNASGALLGLQRYRALAVADVSEGATLLVLTVLVAATHATVTALALAFLGSMSAGLVAIASAARADGIGLAPRGSRGEVGPLVAFGAKASSGNVLQFLTYRLDTFLVNAWAGVGATGLYSVAVRLAELVGLLPSAVGRVVLAKVVSASTEHGARTTRRAFRVTLLMTLAMAVGLVVLGRVVIDVLFSSAFSDAYRGLLWLLPGVVAVSCSSVLSNDIAGRGHPGLNALNSLVGFVVTVVADIALIPSHGYVGAAVASSIAYLVNLVISIEMFSRVSSSRRRVLLLEGRGAA